MADAGLTGGDVDAWLVRRRWWSPFLPRALSAVFEAERRRTRARSGALICAVGAAVTLLFFPVLYGAMQDVRHLLNVVWLGVAVPCFVACSLMSWLNPAPLLREIILGVPTMAVAAALSILNARSKLPGMEMYVGAIVLIALFPAVAQHLRFQVQLLVTAVVLGFYGWSVSESTAVAPGDAPTLILLCAFCLGYMLLANGRMHVEQHHNFALTLRERLRLEALAAENRALDVLSRKDGLTGIANRRAYDAWLMEHWNLAQGRGGVVGLIMLDVDYFKAYNDVFGHPAGDTCLIAIGACLRDLIRGEADLVARIGGEEFGVILPGLSISQCADIAERLRIGVEDLRLPHPHREIVTISCGCASLPAAGTSPTPLCDATDKALYAAKANGRNNVHQAEPWVEQAHGHTAGV